MVGVAGNRAVDSDVCPFIRAPRFNIAEAVYGMVARGKGQVAVEGLFEAGAGVVVDVIADGKVVGSTGTDIVEDGADMDFPIVTLVNHASGGLNVGDGCGAARYADDRRDHQR